ALVFPSFFVSAPATPHFSPLSLHDALPILPVLSTPVGVAPYLLAGIDGCLCAPFDAERWAAAARPHLDAPDPRVAGAARAATLRSEEHTSELQSLTNLVCPLLLHKKTNQRS